LNANQHVVQVSPASSALLFRAVLLKSQKALKTPETQGSREKLFRTHGHFLKNFNFQKILFSKNFKKSFIIQIFKNLKNKNFQKSQK